MWDVEQYERFRGERSRPFFDLLARIPDRSYRTILDLGCGTGELTAVLGEHWPEARVTGVDQSDEMLAPAMSRQEAGRLEFIKGDIANWRPSQQADLVVSNAAFQWVPDPSTLVKHVVSCLAPKGVLAVQIPDNFGFPSHRLLHEIQSDGRWAEKLRARRRPEGTLSVERYIEILWALATEVDAWETTYQHVLVGEDAVLEWMKGTALRPIIAVLDEEERKEFLAQYGQKLREAYPKTGGRTLFPFRRLFFVAMKT